MNQALSESVRQSADLIRECGKICAMTGAGISVESGVPTFRGKGGIWERFDPIEYAHIDTFKKKPEKVWDVLLREMKTTLETAKPNRAHLALVDLEKKGFLDTIITQNVDGLHQLAGNTDVIEYHGSFASLSCMDCGSKSCLSDISLASIPPRCSCNGILRPDCVFFGEMIPAEAMLRAGEAAASCKILLVIGTSATVQPAASIPYITKKNGGKIIEINPEKTILSSELSDIFLQGQAGEIMGAIADELK